MTDENQVSDPAGMQAGGNGTFVQDDAQTQQAVVQGEGTEGEEEVTPIGSFGKDDAYQASVKLPEHNLNFDEVHFLRLLAGSISLTKEEKRRIIDAIPKLSQFQIDELIKILEEERRKFSELDVKHQEQLRKLEEKHAQEWEQLEMEEEQDEKAGEDEAQADDIRKSLGL